MYIYPKKWVNLILRYILLINNNQYMSEISKGYIYVRKHPAYDLYDAVKLGKTCNIVERESTYVTGEIIRGVFLVVIEVDLRDMDYIEVLLKLEFKTALST